MVETVRQVAGGCFVEISPPSPRWVTMVVQNTQGDPVEARLMVHDLHDLRYCINRTLAMIGEPAP